MSKENTEKISTEVRRGITQYEENKTFPGFVAIEWVVMIGAFTYFSVEKFEINIFASLVISAIVSFVLTFSRLYRYLGILFSIGWGYLGYKLFYFLTEATDGGKGLCITIGVVGFILAFLITVGAREIGKEYLNDMNS